jgi:hypothetical protein
MEKTCLILLAVLCFNSIGFSQKAPAFKLTKDGFKPIVIQFDTSFSENFIYTRIKEWIVLNNKNPESVTKVDTKNTLIKFSCYKPEAWKTDKNGIDYWNVLQFTFTIEIKKAKCRVTFDSEETRYKFWYNDDGTLKEKFKESEADFERAVNESLASLYNYIISTGQEQTDDW